MLDNLIYNAETNMYVRYEQQSKSSINRRCIDGSVTGCGNCVGYCQYQEHPGFLTQKQRREHDCINKKCHRYIPKPQRIRTEKNEDISSVLLALARQSVGGIEDIRIMNIKRDDSRWLICYVTVFGQYNFFDMEQKIQEQAGVSVIMQKLNYSFDHCVELICNRC